MHEIPQQMGRVTELIYTYHTIALAAGFILDLIFGDPRWLYHPVCLIGKLISSFEKEIRRVFPKTEKGELAGGLVEVILICVITLLVPAFVLYFLYIHLPVLGVLLETFWCYQLLATRSLRDESMKVYDGSILNYSLEFSGGTATTVTFNEDMDIKQIDSEVTPVVEKVTGDKNVQPTKVVGTNQVIIKTRALSQPEREKLNQAMVDNFDVDEALISTESISSTVSSEMRQDAFVAVVVATLCMLAYIWIRFKDIRFASSAVLALVHDVLVVFAFYALARISVGNTFIACMLTIVGYSINATIVIFDRIRENLKKMGSRADLTEIVNDSITQTLTRSIYTSLTTFVMVAVLYIMGVSSIREFALPLMVGIVCGAYSSVCITGSLWLVMKRGFGKNKVQAIASKNVAAENKNTAQTSGQKSDNGQKQPKKKNRKRVAERLAAQEAEKNAEENKTE